MADAGKAPLPVGVTLTADPKVARMALEKGGRVVYVGRSVHSTVGRFIPVYWSTVHFPIMDPCPMIGTWFDEDHPVFASFPTEDWMDRQWRSLTEASFVHELTADDHDLKPMAMPVPDIHVSRFYATLFEAKVGRGRLLVCGYPIGAAETAEARQLRRSVLDYVKSDAFCPQTERSLAWFSDFACSKREGQFDPSDVEVCPKADGTVRIVLHGSPKAAGRYAILFAEDGTVGATFMGRPATVLSAVPVIYAFADATADDAADGCVHFDFKPLGGKLPPVAHASFEAKGQARVKSVEVGGCRGLNSK